MRRIGNQQLNVEIKVGNFTEVSLQHLAITQYPDPLTVVVHFIMNELFQLRPVLLIQAGNVVSVDVAEVGFNHGNFPCASTAAATAQLPAAMRGERTDKRSSVASPSSCLLATSLAERGRARPEGMTTLRRPREATRSA